MKEIGQGDKIPPLIIRTSVPRTGVKVKKNEHRFSPWNRKAPDPDGAPYSVDGFLRVG
jgi:hypothetical protein